MNLAESLPFLLIWSRLGILAFSVLVIVLFRSGLVWTARHKDGSLKENIPLQGRLTMLATLGIFIGLQLAASANAGGRFGTDIGFIDLLILNYLLYLAVFMYDSLIIDYLVIVIWRPHFMRLPDEMGRESMLAHIRASVPVGLVAGLILSVLSTLIARLLFF